MKAKRRLLFFLIPAGVGLAAILLIGTLLRIVEASEPPSTFTVKNASGIEITNTVVSGKGFKEVVGIVKPGESVTKRFRPGAKSGIAVSFWAGDRVVSVPEQDYVSGGGGWKVSIEVSPDLSVSVRSEIVA